MMQKIFNNLIDFLFPPNPEEVQLRSIPMDWLVLNVPKASKAEFPFIDALFSYKNPFMRELIWQIKYKKNNHTVKCAGYALYSELCKKIVKDNRQINPENNQTLLIPIPISIKRRKERGYNQCELIINEIINLDKENKFIKNFDFLIREKDVEKQTHKNREERLSNTKHIFKIINGDLIDLNQKIIIIDDVTTTGSTLKEARDELLKKGYLNVEALAVAH